MMDKRGETNRIKSSHVLDCPRDLAICYSLRVSITLQLLNQYFIILCDIDNYKGLH